ncbi:inositol monophosphatase [Candidatus Peregrinibacteria bacterium]|nr:inositol monophosphatase [Candidatus Peregrinibacteria bacterium]
MKTLSNYTTTALSVAKKCGEILTSYYHKETLSYTKKGYNDIATEADIASEKNAIHMIHNQFPDHAIYAEESGKQNSDSPYRWIIDPLDGTTNFKHRLPVFAVSIALEIKNELHCGVIYAPKLQELFVAEQGKGAFLNEQAVHVSSTNGSELSLAATGFIPNKPKAYDNLAIWSHVSKSGYPLRRLGAASIDLAYTACGRFDAFWEFGLHPWDIAAGMLIIQEAGGTVTTVDNKPIHVESPSILATNGAIHNTIQEVIHEASE